MPKTEIIVKYNGDLSKLSKDLNAEVEVLLDNRYAIITLDEEKIPELINYPQIEYIERPKDLKLYIDKSMESSCVKRLHESPTNLKGKGVIIGIIDSGIDYVHPDFIDDSGKSRIISIWDQTIDGRAPEGFNEGFEWNGAEIDDGIKTKSIQHVDVVGHGTHVAGIAAGNGRKSNGKYVGAAPEAKLIIVKVGTKGQKDFGKSTEIMRALKYIIFKARELNMPVAVNLSFGTNDGAHTDNSIFEDYINDIADIWKNVIVVAAGNEGNSARHTSGKFQEGKEIVLSFNASGGEKRIDLQMYKNFFDNIRIRIQAPNQKISQEVDMESLEGSFVLQDSKVTIKFIGPNPFNREDSAYITFEGVDGKSVNGGIWKIIIMPTKIEIGNFDIWLPISEALSEKTKFLEPTIENTFTIPGTCRRVITVGSYNASDDSIAPFSGRGKDLADYIKPDFVAPGTNITSTVPGGFYDSMTGTSMATPHVTGSAALLMEWGLVQGNDLELYGERVKAYLAKMCKRDKKFLTYPNNAWGNGKLCLYNSLLALEGLKAIRTVVAEESKINYYLSENYMDYIIQYEGDIVSAVNAFGNSYVKILDDTYAIISIRKERVEEFFKAVPNVVFKESPQIYSLFSNEALDATNAPLIQNHPYTPLTGNKVIVAVIDTGIDYMHKDFQYEDDTSKIISIWDQTIEGIPPKGYDYGTEWGSNEINQAISEAKKGGDPYKIVAEKDEIGHGTHIAGIAAGRGRVNNDYIGVAPDSDLIIVKLKKAKKIAMENAFVFNEEQDKTPNYQSTDVLLALKYVIGKANELGRPVVVNIGFGTNQSAHDGSSIVENLVDDLCKKRGVVIVVANGNQGDAAGHAEGTIQKNGDVEKIEFTVGEGEKGLRLAIWNKAPDKMSVGIISPTGENISKIQVKIQQEEKTKLVLENTTVYIEYRIPEETTGDQVIYILLQDPTPGNWIINLYGDYIVNGRYDIWMPVYSLLQKGTKFLTPNPFTTICTPGTAKRVITAGGYNSKDGSLYSASSRGYTRDDRVKPDLVAPAVDIVSTVPGGGYGSMTGTSQGGAFVTGAAALILEWGIIKNNDLGMYCQKVKTYLIRGAKHRYEGKYPDPEWGYGKLDILGVFEQSKSVLSRNVNNVRSANTRSDNSNTRNINTRRGNTKRGNTRRKRY